MTIGIDAYFYYLSFAEHIFQLFIINRSATQGRQLMKNYWTTCAAGQIEHFGFLFSHSGKLCRNILQTDSNHLLVPEGKKEKDKQVRVELMMNFSFLCLIFISFASYVFFLNFQKFWSKSIFKCSQTFMLHFKRNTNKIKW